MRSAILLQETEKTLLKSGANCISTSTKMEVVDLLPAEEQRLVWYETERKFWYKFDNETDVKKQESEQTYKAREAEARADLGILTKHRAQLTERQERLFKELTQVDEELAQVVEERNDRVTKLNNLKQTHRQSERDALEERRKIANRMKRFFRIKRGEDPNTPSGQHRYHLRRKSIQGAFGGAGLVPFEPKSDLLRLDVRLRTPSPVDEALDLPNRWANYIKRRISHYLGSSPTSILDPVDQITRGTCRMMHKMAPLKAEVEQLRTANALLSKQRRAKKTHLRQGCMIIAEGQSLRGQNDAEEQMRQEDRLKRGRKPLDERQGRRCGTCGKTGHNARTCQIDVETSNEENSSKN
ncbi:hypothetical protein VFPPC_11828 [Pochonia chlamydosporia 170]|uniref:CCHC-type domain-containing protein n=1 Tax=Pochonia chlamydosporia 170 TaxID=1380566 RepID=A0A179EWE8_METCM|nr:hypothetical protein VFPPC_11828 [Pochonia chlamydosporia 170]OAQ57496.2 hypothetical protein VFPPC_11828 [Pochonia chlamydosporia 170]